MKRFSCSILVFLIFIFSSFAQNAEEELQRLNYEIEQLNQKRDSLRKVVEIIKLSQLKEALIKYGLPKLQDDDELICHSAFCLVYDEKHEVAKWTAHIISREVVKGTISRTNDFRIDSLIKTGSAQQEDYFLIIENDDGTIKYDGFGFDRGHLAPSADFRWSEIALSESYYYSNMTPQLPKFNREVWAEIENFARSYIVNHPDRDLFVITAPILHDSLPKIERSINKVSIPEYHYKILFDTVDKKAIAFLVNQYKLDYPIESYVVTIDSIQKITGLEFYTAFDEETRNKILYHSDISLWRSEKEKYDKAPIPKNQLPKDHYNTVDAKMFIDYPKDVTVCGTVVSAHKSRKGHVFLNLDKSFPHQIFTATIWSSNLVNFSYELEKFLLNKRVCIKGRVKDYQGVPSIYPDNEKKIKILE
ncbi:MAG TPA: DNA/RNA non-specific endonuclease [Bacteroidales bacterium]|nr:DNA/RNA non-specific endonuclease [Bacteroidales bacterium]HOL99133.1 DNA/RNA non-specific endonuclease [Bacteroidales bacterium]HUM33587.1 DNA/RNA non-specific endonuclease [Bacteroidales bacterium]